MTACQTAKREGTILRLGLAVMLVALNLRPAAASVGPLIHRIQLGNGLSSAGASALTTLPVLCFGLLAGTAPLLARRLGVHAAMGVAMALLLAGQLIRLISGVGFLFIGTAVAGCAIAIANVLMPVTVRRDFTNHAGAALSAFSAVLIASAALAAGVSVPVATAFGGGWKPGLGVWAIPAAVAAIIWLPALIRHGSEDLGDASDAPTGSAAGAIRQLLREPLAWEVTLFFAVLSGGFYATLAWLPSIFRSHGASEAHAGLLLSVTLIVGIVTGLIVPAIAGRLRDQRVLVLGTCLLTTAGWLGILLAPMSASYLWASLLGLGQNGSFPLALMLIVLRGGSVRTTQALSTMAQSGGYSLAAFAPLLIGTLHGLTHSWTPEVLLLTGLSVPQLLVGMPAGRQRQLEGPHSGR
jgi:CP family cyanate transporter-like MFS transporter